MNTQTEHVHDTKIHSTCKAYMYTLIIVQTHHPCLGLPRRRKVHSWIFKLSRP